MKAATVAEVEGRLRHFVKASAVEPVILTQNGQPVAVLYGMLDEDDLERLRLSCNPKFQKMMADARRRIQEGGGIPHDEFWRRIEKKYPQAFAKKKGKHKKSSTPRAR